MESPWAIGGSEEHSGGSESGWTNYIGSTTQNENDNSKDPRVDDDDDDESEDSMASDASSGPSHHELPNGEGEGSGSMGHTHIRHAKDEANSKLFSEKKASKQVKKKDERRVKEQNELSAYRAESAGSQVSSGAKSFMVN
ncbi:protein SOB FIVE-LIKE 2-like [Juglans microcarpa x Juglans regia]|uniref:protein SOB FIVE-LIKE 2-like n=1 Tax=Juglans microcarpa x Juglans regia TaxID=2249226 RepID=UPI001B7E0519|nr:protein SOB FIVE-LIKE 2-like [Juglans microcarpa x Juglans regia]